MQPKKTIRKAHKKPSSREQQARYSTKKTSRLSRRQRLHITILSTFIVFVAVLGLLVQIVTPTPVEPVKKKTSTKQEEKVNKKNYPSVTVVVDPGHGGYDGGNIGYSGSVEKEWTLEYALAFGEDLKELNPNINVVYTRDSDEVSWPEDEESDLKARVQIANEANADYFISFHLNSNDQSSSLDNMEFFVRGEDDVSIDIAEQLGKNLQKNGWDYNYNIQDVATYPLYVVSQQTNRPSLLFEIGYSSNPAQEKKMMKKSTIEKIAETTAETYHKYILKHNK